MHPWGDDDSDNLRVLRWRLRFSRRLKTLEHWLHPNAEFADGCRPGDIDAATRAALSEAVPLTAGVDLVARWTRSRPGGIFRKI